MKTKLTTEDKQYIKENRMHYSMMDMAIWIGCSYNRVRNYMIQNDLMVSKKTAYQIRSRKMGTAKNNDLPWDWDALP